MAEVQSEWVRARSIFHLSIGWMRLPLFESLSSIVFAFRMAEGNRPLARGPLLVGTRQPRPQLRLRQLSEAGLNSLDHAPRHPRTRGMRWTTRG